VLRQSAKLVAREDQQYESRSTLHLRYRHDNQGGDLLASSNQCETLVRSRFPIIRPIS
jgi:hypothetical protein